MVGVGLVNILNEPARDYYGPLFAILEQVKKLASLINAPHCDRNVARADF